MQVWSAMQGDAAISIVESWSLDTCRRAEVPCKLQGQVSFVGRQSCIDRLLGMILLHPTLVEPMQERILQLEQQVESQKKENDIIRSLGQCVKDDSAQ